MQLLVGCHPGPVGRAAAGSCSASAQKDVKELLGPVKARKLVLHVAVVLARGVLLVTPPPTVVVMHTGRSP
jgi:hypothetical protein